MERIKIKDRKSFDYLESRGFIPLFDLMFDLDVDLRIVIQRERFNINADIERANYLFYIYNWKIRKHICEECMKPLHDYSSVYISHILSRGANADLAFDVRNINILCFEHHNAWENGNRESMRINNRNKGIINILKQEYRIKSKK